MNSRLQQFMESKADGVFSVGHASLLVRLDGELTLFDPVFGNYKPYSDHWVFWPEQIDCSEILPLVTRIIVSHLHMDHLCEPVLQQARCPVHVMKGLPGLRERIESCGRQVVEHEPFQWRKFTDTVDIFYCPHPFNAIDSFPFLRGKNTTVALGSDCFLDGFRLHQIERALPPIHYAFIPYAYIHWWPFLQEGITEEFKQQEINRLVEQSANQAQLFCEVLKPKMAFGTGASLYYNAPSTHILNRHLFAPPPAPLKYFTAGAMVLDGQYTDCQPNYGIPCAEPAPLDMTMPKDVELEPLYRLQQKLDKAKRCKSSGWKILINRYRVDDTNECALVIDPYKLEARVRFGNFDDIGPHYSFFFSREVFEAWLQGTLTFEAAIGTRRFTFRRVPDVYDQNLFAWWQEWL